MIHTQPVDVKEFGSITYVLSYGICGALKKDTDS